MCCAHFHSDFVKMQSFSSGANWVTFMARTQYEYSTAFSTKLLQVIFTISQLFHIRSFSLSPSFNPFLLYRMQESV